MRKTPEERFDEKYTINQETGCWEWTASTSVRGYGRFVLDGSLRQAHRVSYERHVGPIPDGLQLDHLCRVRHCVNWEHLDPVTNRQNARRGITGEVCRARMLAKTHCPSGHAYSGENLYVAPSGYRKCRTCDRQQKARVRAADRDGHNAREREYRAANRDKINRRARERAAAARLRSIAGLPAKEKP